MGVLSEKTMGEIKAEFDEKVNPNNIFVNTWVDRFTNIGKSGNTIQFKEVSYGKQVSTNLEIKYEMSEQVRDYRSLQASVQKFLQTKDPTILDRIQNSATSLGIQGKMSVKLDVMINSIRETTFSKQDMESYLKGEEHLGAKKEGDLVELNISGQREVLEVKGYMSPSSEGDGVKHNFMVKEDLAGNERAFDVKGNSIDIKGFMIAKQEFIDIQNNPFATELDKQEALVQERILEKYMDRFEISNTRVETDQNEGAILLEFDPATMTQDELNVKVTDFINSLKDVVDNYRLDPRTDFDYQTGKSMEDIKDIGEQLQELRQELYEKNEGASPEEREQNWKEYNEKASEIDREIGHTRSSSVTINDETITD